MKKRITFGDDAAFFQEENLVPRHRRFTVTQIVYRSAAFLQDLDHDVDKRRQRLTSASTATAAASHLRSSRSFVHVPDILNPIPSRCASPIAGRRNNNNNGVNYNDRRGIWRKLGNRNLFGSSSDSNIRNDEDEWDSDNQSR